MDILIVDDDRRLAASCARLLEQAGYVCRQAHDGPGALAEVRREPPALVLLDLLLPKIDGRRVLAEIRRSPEIAHIPVVVISGVFKDKRVARECQEAGARAFLEKPFEGDALLGAVRALVGTPETERDEPPADEMRVPLSDVPVSEYTWRTMRSGFSGAIHFQRGKMHKVLLLESGQPRAIRSNAMRETLGERLVQAGRINARQNEESRTRAKQEGRLQGELLVEMGLITPQAVERCLQEQVEEKLVETFRWVDGEAWLQPGVRAVSYASDLSDWSQEDVILVGALQMRFDRVMAILTTFAEQRLAPTRKALPKRAGSLAPITAAMRAAGESKTVGALLADHAAPLYGLWLTGHLEFRSESHASRAAAPARTAQSSAARPAGASAPQAGSGDPPTSPVGADALSAVLAQWKSQTFFEVLGLTEASTRDEIQAAYLKLARRFHPDRFSRETESVRACATEIFALLSAARDILCDPPARLEYTKKLRGGSSDEERQKVQRILRAERLCQQGEALLKKRDVPGALAVFAEAVQLDPTEGEFHALFAWAHFLAHRGDDSAERLAIEKLQQAVDLAPESPKGYYYLAQLHKACDRTDMARKFFAKVLQLDPEHVEANREQRLLNMRKDKDPKPSGGIFGFGRKKT